MSTSSPSNKTRPRKSFLYPLLDWLMRWPSFIFIFFVFPDPPVDMMSRNYCKNCETFVILFLLSWLHFHFHFPISFFPRTYSIFFFFPSSFCFLYSFNIPSDFFFLFSFHYFTALFEMTFSLYIQFSFVSLKIVSWPRVAINFVSHSFEYYPTMFYDNNTGISIFLPTYTHIFNGMYYKFVSLNISLYLVDKAPTAEL